MQVSFIIPLYNCLPFTQAMLASLRETLPPGLAHEIIFVDDGSTDGTREWLKSLAVPCHVLLNDRNLGFAGTCNRGAAAARGEFLFFLNNDLVLLPGWLEPMLAVARRRRVALVGNVQLNTATGAVDHTGIFFNFKGKPEHDTARPLLARLTGIRRVTALTGACFAIRRQHWQSLGGFDEGFVNGGEDIDLCLRARQARLRNCVSLRSVVRHHISTSPGRKSHDEQNTARLVQRWRHAIARHAALDWCRYHLSLHWEEPRDYPDLPVARDCFLYCCRLLTRPTGGILIGVHTAIEAEVERWKKLLA